MMSFDLQIPQYDNSVNFTKEIHTIQYYTILSTSMSIQVPFRVDNKLKIAAVKLLFKCYETIQHLNEVKNLSAFTV